MLKGLLYLVSFAFLFCGDGQQVIASLVGDVVGDVVRGDDPPCVVVIRYLFPPYYVI